MTAPRAGAAFAPLMKGRATIFMLHRFKEPGSARVGDDPGGLRRVLAHLRRERYDLLDLEDVVRRLAGDGPPINRGVAFTIDDGYADQAEVGAPVFREFDCPVTTFVTTGFLDRRLWFWWDRVEYILEHTDLRSLSLPHADSPAMPLETEEHRARARRSFTGWCKDVPDAAKLEAINVLAERADVELPSNAPPGYAPMSWAQLRRCEEGGMRFGPHTDTHPILAQVSDEQARVEIRDSWRRVREEARNPTPVFCYPNGQRGDYGPREIELLEEAGLFAAVAGTPGIAARVSPNAPARFEVPRIVFNTNVGRAVQFVSGAERFMDFFRSRG